MADIIDRLSHSTANGIVNSVCCLTNDSVVTKTDLNTERR